MTGNIVQSRESKEQTQKALEQMAYRERRLSFFALKEKTIEVTLDLVEYDNSVAAAIREFRSNKKRSCFEQLLYVSSVLDRAPDS